MQSQLKSPAPEGWLLHRIDWDYFVTLTHGGEGWIRNEDGEKENRPGRWKQPSHRRQAHRIATYLRKVCSGLKIHANSIRWVKRLEIGKGGREHFHLLINFHKRSLVNKTTKHFLSGVWEQLEYGIANCRSCKTTGVQAYITKVQNSYEMSRFGSDRFRHVEFSKSALKNLRRASKHVAAHTGY